MLRTLRPPNGSDRRERVSFTFTPGDADFLEGLILVNDNEDMWLVTEVLAQHYKLSKRRGDEWVHMGTYQKSLAHRLMKAIGMLREETDIESQPYCDWSKVTLP
jgi:hypothetical protein